MKRPLLIGGLLVVLVIVYSWSRRDAVAPTTKEVASASSPRPAKPQVVTLPASAPALAMKLQSRPHPATDSYRSIFDSRDIKHTVDDVLKNGTADQKGWAASLVQDCGAVLNSPDFAKRAENSGDAAKAAAKDLVNRCGGFKGASREELKELRESLRAGAKDSISDYAKLHALSSRADAGDTRWSTVDEAFIAQGLYSDDPVLAYAALEVVISCIDRNVVGADDRTLALRMVQGRMAEGNRGQVTELMFCATGSTCNASNSPPVDTTTRDMQRLENAYQSALDAKASPSHLLTIR